MTRPAADRSTRREALQQMGAECRTLQVPGVYGGFQTTMPAILSSSFAEVLWMDTDVTPLLDPELLFETDAFKREGALFWPDLWGQGHRTLRAFWFPSTSTEEHACHICGSGQTAITENRWLHFLCRFLL